MPNDMIARKYGTGLRFVERLTTRLMDINTHFFATHDAVRELQPSAFMLEQTTYWRFVKRGSWATHNASYRGNWSPYIPRNVILRYSAPGELVVDYFCGAGTTAVECKLLGRRCIAVDINENAIALAKSNVDFSKLMLQLNFLHDQSNMEIYEPELVQGNASDLSFIGDATVDLICAHPPYWDQIKYSSSIDGDLSLLKLDEYLLRMEQVAKESFRILKPARQCAILIGDTRRELHVIPLGAKLIDIYMRAGFELREIIIRHTINNRLNCIYYRKALSYNFLLIENDYLLVFEKPVRATRLVSDDRHCWNYRIIAPEITGSASKEEYTCTWVLPTDDAQRRIDDNVVRLYSKDRNYLFVDYDESDSGANDADDRISDDRKSMVFIKLPVLNANAPYRSLLASVKGLVSRLLPIIVDNGYLVIQVGDFRDGTYIVPMTKHIIDTIDFDSLWLKEMVSVIDGYDRMRVPVRHDNCLELVHRHLLVFEKARRKWR